MEAPCCGSTSAVARFWPPICYSLNEVTEASLLVTDGTDGEGTKCSGEALVIRDQQWSSFGQSCFPVITVWLGGCRRVGIDGGCALPLGIVLPGKHVLCPALAQLFFLIHKSVSLWYDIFTDRLLYPAWLQGSMFFFFRAKVKEMDWVDVATETLITDSDRSV